MLFLAKIWFSYELDWRKIRVKFNRKIFEDGNCFPRKSTENNEPNEETILPTELEELESVNINDNEFKIVNDLEDHDNTENSKHDFIDLKQIIK